MTMTDITLSNIGSGYNLNKINDNFQTIQEVVNDEILHTEGGNNTMEQALDMNSNPVINGYTDVSDPKQLLTVEAADARYVGAHGGGLISEWPLRGTKVVSDSTYTLTEEDNGFLINFTSNPAEVIVPDGADKLPTGFWVEGLFSGGIANTTLHTLRFNSPAGGTFIGADAFYESQQVRKIPAASPWRLIRNSSPSAASNQCTLEVQTAGDHTVITERLTFVDFGWTEASSSTETDSIYTNMKALAESTGACIVFPGQGIVLTDSGFEVDWDDAKIDFNGAKIAPGALFDSEFAVSISKNNAYIAGAVTLLADEVAGFIYLVGGTDYTIEGPIKIIDGSSVLGSPFIFDTHFETGTENTQCYVGDIILVGGAGGGDGVRLNQQKNINLSNVYASDTPFRVFATGGSLVENITVNSIISINNERGAFYTNNSRGLNVNFIKHIGGGSAVKMSSGAKDVTINSVDIKVSSIQGLYFQGAERCRVLSGTVVSTSADTNSVGVSFIAHSEALTDCIDCSVNLQYVEASNPVNVSAPTGLTTRRVSCHVDEAVATFTGSRGNGLYVDAGSGTVEDCYFSGRYRSLSNSGGSGNDAVRIESGDRITLENVYGETTNRSGIFVASGCTNTKVMRCYGKSTVEVGQTNRNGVIVQDPTAIVGYTVSEAPFSISIHANAEAFYNHSIQ